MKFKVGDVVLYKFSDVETPVSFQITNIENNSYNAINTRDFTNLSGKTWAAANFRLFIYKNEYIVGFADEYYNQQILKKALGIE